MDTIASLIWLILPLAIGLAVLRLTLDKRRVRQYLEERGHTVIAVRWKLFGHGWIHEASSDNGGGNRIYDVEYRDVYGDTHRVWAKTAMFSGVFLSMDRITAQATTSKEPMSAEQKIAFLEEELRKARRSC